MVRMARSFRVMSAVTWRSLSPRCTLDEKTKSIRVQLRASWADVARPLPVCEAKAGSRGSSIKLQVPLGALDCRTWDVTVPPGAVVLAAGPMRRGKRAQLLLLEVAHSAVQADAPT